MVAVGRDDALLTVERRIPAEVDDRPQWFALDLCASAGDVAALSKTGVHPGLASGRTAGGGLDQFLHEVLVGDAVPEDLLPAVPAGAVVASGAQENGTTTTRRNENMFDPSAIR